MKTDAMMAVVHKAWSAVPAPPAIDLRYIEQECGQDSARAFVGVAPVDVDISSPGFLGCMPLFDIPPKATAAYLGTYVLSLLHGLRVQERVGLFADVISRAHTIHCLTAENFWRDVIRPHLSEECRQALRELSVYLASRRALLDLPKEQSDSLVSLAEMT